MTTPDAFYISLGDNRYAATGHTRGPWDYGSQHGGPPSALLAQLIDTREGFRVARIAYEIMRPVPIAELEVAVNVVRSGRTVEIVEATLSPVGGRPVLRATAVLIKAVPGSVPEVQFDPAVPGAAEGEPDGFFAVTYDEGWHTAMEFRFTEGDFMTPGPATGWMRMRYPLVLGQETLPVARVLIAADSGNGISNLLDWERYIFINPDLTVHLQRYPVGEWVCVQARTSIDPGGIGLAESALHDEKGPIGRGAQSLVISERAQ